MKESPTQAGYPGGAFAASDIVVVIAAYNAESTLAAALGSIAAQSHPPGSVVVVDDASGDATADVARKWKDLLPLRLISQSANTGPSEARRKGIEETSEPLIATLDADDIWMPDHLSLMLATYHQAAGLITADAINWMPGQGVGRSSYRRTRRIPLPPRQLKEIMVANYVFTAVLFARADYAMAGGFRAGIVGPEDWDLWIRMLRAGVVVTGTPYPTVLYRVHPRALSRRGQQQIQNEVRVLELAVTEARGPRDRADAERGLRIQTARLNLLLAYASARQGDTGAARTAALKACLGSRAIALRAAAMVLAPRRAVRFRDRVEWQPSVRIGR
jgi:glycosyltransferase involved in cell wall biosynthesis